MATLATNLNRPDEPGRRTGRTQDDPYVLRALPNEDVFFFCKRIENRVVRQADPRARGACWSALGAACILAALLTAALAPGVANTLAGYKIEALKQERQRLLDERARLEVEEAALLSPARMQQLAAQQKMAAPASGQVVHLEGKSDSALASLDFRKETKGR